MNGVEKAAVHSTKKGSGDKLTLQEGPIKITQVKIYVANDEFILGQGH